MKKFIMLLRAKIVARKDKQAIIEIIKDFVNAHEHMAEKLMEEAQKIERKSCTEAIEQFYKTRDANLEKAKAEALLNVLSIINK